MQDTPEMEKVISKYTFTLSTVPYKKNKIAFLADSIKEKEMMEFCFHMGFKINKCKIKQQTLYVSFPFGSSSIMKSTGVPEEPQKHFVECKRMENGLKKEGKMERNHKCDVLLSNIYSN